MDDTGERHGSERPGSDAARGLPAGGGPTGAELPTGADLPTGAELLPGARLPTGAGPLPGELRALGRALRIPAVDAETMVERVLADLVGVPLPEPVTADPQDGPMEWGRMQESGVGNPGGPSGVPDVTGADEPPCPSDGGNSCAVSPLWRAQQRPDSPRC